MPALCSLVLLTLKYLNFIILLKKLASLFWFHFAFQNYHLAISEAHSGAQSCNSGWLFIFLSHFCVCAAIVEETCSTFWQKVLHEFESECFNIIADYTPSNPAQQPLKIRCKHGNLCCMATSPFFGIHNFPTRLWWSHFSGRSLSIIAKLHGLCALLSCLMFYDVLGQKRTKMNRKMWKICMAKENTSIFV